jgi:hypothetical protein
MRSFKRSLVGTDIDVFHPGYYKFFFIHPWPLCIKLLILYVICYAVSEIDTSQVDKLVKMMLLVWVVHISIQ